MDIFSFFIGLLLAALLSVIIFYYIYTKSAKRFSYYITKLSEENRGVQEAYTALNGELHEAELARTKLAQELAFAQEKIDFLQESRREIKEEFEHIAREVIEQKSSALSQKQQESLKLLLTPFSENIRNFQQKVEQFYAQESKERFSLIKEIDALKNLNQRISQDALNLTNALKGDNKLQGNWGEMILEKVLENSGLTKGREYEIQKAYKDENGKLYKPDVIIHLPDKKDVVIDSKVSLKAYEQYHSATEEEARERHLKAHLDSLYIHIKQLSKKRYEMLEGVTTLDFVLLFIPIEAAFMTAIEADRELYEKAYRKNIIIVSPSTLLAVLRTIEHSWRYEYQNKNAREIARKAGDLYDKFRGFVESMQTIEKSLHKAQHAYNDAFKKLSSGKGNLMTRAKELKSMEGIEHKKMEYRTKE
ncbi:MAG: DNA recombination protein RmuC [Sulfurospirillum sp.]|nr:MAG: DNA recombination protein RmuC [Sulfurospirillum sp.]